MDKFKLDDLMESAREAVRVLSCSVSPSFARQSWISFSSFRKTISFTSSALAVLIQIQIAPVTLCVCVCVCACVCVCVCSTACKITLY